MKKLMLLKFVLFFPILLLTFNAFAIMSPLHGNWLNPMSGGSPQNSASIQTYVFLDQGGNLNINLVVTTTDNNMDNYDPLVIGYSFGTNPAHNGHTSTVTQGDLVQIEPGVYEAVYAQTFNYDIECQSSNRGVLPKDISIKLEMPLSGGGYEDYPMAQNAGLFDPSEYEDYYSEYTTSKYLVCWGVDPTFMTSNDDPNAVAEDAGMPLNQASDNTLENTVDVKIKSEKVLQATRAYPNPFYNTLSLAYILKSPSAVQIRILDMTGKQIAQKNKTVQQIGEQQVEFTFDNDIPPGLYTALISYSGETEAIKVIKLKALK